MKPTNQYCRFYIVRHAQSEGNVQGLVQGHADFNLTDEGVRSAGVLAKELKDIHFDAMFASDLTRARHTAEIIAAEHALAVKTTQLLREQNFGKYNGKEAELFRTELKEMLAEYESLADADKFSYKLQADIESDAETVARIITFIREIALAYPGKTTLMVTHGAIIRKLLIHLGFGTYQELDHGAIRNLAYFVVESDGIDFFVRETSGITKST